MPIEKWFGDLHWTKKKRDEQKCETERVQQFYNIHPQNAIAINVFHSEKNRDDFPDYPNLLNVFPISEKNTIIIFIIFTRKRAYFLFHISYFSEKMFIDFHRFVLNILINICQHVIFFERFSLKISTTKKVFKIFLFLLKV